MIRAAIIDVDDVLLNMDAAAASADQAVGDHLAAHTCDEPTARAVQARFTHGYDLLRGDLRRGSGEPAPEYNELISAVTRWQRGVVDAGYEVKRWSRDSLLAIALEHEGQRVDRATIGGAMSHYWAVLAAESIILDDVAPFLSLLTARDIRYHLATNSDGFLTFDDDLDTLVYDPAEAIAKKKNRLGLLSTLGIEGQDISVGDPIGKPDPRFFERVFEAFGARHKVPLNPAETIVIGDSLSNDVLPPLSLGAALGAWLVREDDVPGPVLLDGRDDVWRVRSLAEIGPLL